MRLVTARAIDRGVVLLATVLLAGRQYSFPSKELWTSVERDQPFLLIGLIVLVGTFAAIAPVEVFSQRVRLGRRVALRRQILTTFGQLLDLGVSSTPPTPISDLGLHIWQKGVLFCTR